MREELLKKDKTIREEVEKRLDNALSAKLKVERLKSHYKIQYKMLAAHVSEEKKTLSPRVSELKNTISYLENEMLVMQERIEKFLEDKVVTGFHKGRYTGLCMKICCARGWVQKI